MLLRSFENSQFWVSSISMLMYYTSNVYGNMGCNQAAIFGNFEKMCRTYAHLKRSPGGFHPGLRNTEFRQQLQQQSSPQPPNGYFGSGIPQQSGQPVYQPQQQQWDYNPWGRFAQPIPLYYPHPAYGPPFYGQQPQPQPQPENSSYEDLFNPINYAGTETQQPIERWRRDDDINRFIYDKCCVHGCRFPIDYLEFDKQTNICQLR